MSRLFKTSGAPISASLSTSYRQVMPICNADWDWRCSSGPAQAGSRHCSQPPPTPQVPMPAPSTGTPAPAGAPTRRRRPCALCTRLRSPAPRFRSICPIRRKAETDLGSVERPRHLRRDTCRRFCLMRRVSDVSWRGRVEVGSTSRRSRPHLVFHVPRYRCPLPGPACFPSSAVRH